MSQPNMQPPPRPTWLIHNRAVRGEAYENLADLVRQLGYDAWPIDDWQVTIKDDLDLPSTDACVIPYCTYVAARSLTRYFGMYMNEYNQRYHVYTSLMGLSHREFLNHDAILTTFYQFRTRRDYWFGIMNRVGDDSDIFIRPDSGAKLFTGCLIPRVDWNHQINYLQRTSVTDDSLVWVSSEKVFWDETRFIICGNEVVDGSRYCTDSGRDLVVDKNFPAEFWELAQKVANCKWKPEEVFTCDICMTRDGPKIVELNSFNCAGWYACDPAKIITKVSEHTLKLWEEVYE
jgi:hypothetical protein